MRALPFARLPLRLAAAAVLFLPTAAFGLEALSIDPAWVPKSTPPASAPATIRGIGFTPTTTVTFDAVSATVTFVDSRTLQVQVPTSATGKVSTVTVTDGASSDILFPFIYTNKNLYVSSAGNDSNNGTSPATPKRNISSAIDATSTTVTNLIRVTAGRFGDNQLGLPTGTVLAGGYNPTFTTRNPDLNVSEVDSAEFGFNLRSFGLDAKVVVDGLTFMGGLRDGANGGSLEFVGDDVVVSNSVIVGNTSSAMGGGIYLGFTPTFGGRTTISNNVIIGNRSHAGAGGGIVIYPLYTSGNPLNVEITDNYIVGNRSYLSRGGGVGIRTNSFYGYNQLDLKMVDNSILGNSAKAGAGVSFTLSTHTDGITFLSRNNVIGQNKTPGDGGGLTVGGVGSFTGSLVSSTIASNTAGVGSGAGLTISAGVNVSPPLSIHDLILWGNVLDDSSGPMSLTYSDVGGGGLPGAGNISSDPTFVKGLRGRFYLGQNDPNEPVSPAIDVGSDTAALTGNDGLTTAADGTADAGMVDMGAHFKPAPADSPDPIQLLRLDPPTGDTMGNDWVLLRGTGFDPGARANFGSGEATTTIYINSNKILAQPAAHTPGTVTVTVTNPDDTADNIPGGYRFLDNTPPVWPTTTGAQSAASPLDCVRSVIVDWNPAADLLSSPAKYEVYRGPCAFVAGASPPCTDWFDFIPSAANLLATTAEMSYIDTAFASGGADPHFIYIVRAVDSASPLNRELNFSKRVATATKNTSDTTPPAPVGETLDLPIAGSGFIDWGFSRGAVAYRLYRQTNAAAYATPASLTALITLTAANNDGDGDGLVDTEYTDVANPVPGQAFFYKVTSLDPCNVEGKTQDLLP